MRSATIDGQRIIPLRDQVVVAKDPYKEKTPGGLILPGVAQMRPRQGRVLAVGPGREQDGRTIPVQVEPGNHIAFGNFAGVEVDPDDELLVVMKEEDIWVVLGD